MEVTEEIMVVKIKPTSYYYSLYRVNKIQSKTTDLRITEKRYNDVGKLFPPTKIWTNSSKMSEQVKCLKGKDSRWTSSGPVDIPAKSKLKNPILKNEVPNVTGGNFTKNNLNYLFFSGRKCDIYQMQKLKGHINKIQKETQILFYIVLVKR